MSAQAYAIEFDGYWRDEHRKSIPAKSGIYCVYSCLHNKEKKTVTIDKLIYIGESEDVRNRIDKHGKREAWEKNLLPNQELCYSFVTCPPKSDPL